MAIDRLQEKIRKMKNPSVVNLSVLPEEIPGAVLESTDNFVKAREVFAIQLMEGLQNIIPAVRFSFDLFALHGAKGLESLERLLLYAKKLGFYVFLESPEALSARNAQYAADTLMNQNCRWYFDGLILVSYIGSDGLEPYVSQLKSTGKDLFAVVRTANKSAAQLQDLLTGTRLMHMANADIVNRYAPMGNSRCGYSQVAILASASSGESLRLLREKYKDIFLLMDGCDYPNANAKNCSFGFDRLGHGAAACCGESITAAWKNATMPEGEYVAAAVEAAMRLKKNLLRYVTIL